MLSLESVVSSGEAFCEDSAEQPLGFEHCPQQKTQHQEATGFKMGTV
jgi:hypothetical protein